MEKMLEMEILRAVKHNFFALFGAGQKKIQAQKNAGEGKN